MGSGLFALAAFFLGWIGGAAAAPMTAIAAVPSLISQRAVETVRWRHRYRNYGWRERGTGASEAGSAADDGNVSPAPAAIGPDVGRRSYRSRSWRRDATRHEPGGFAFDLGSVNRVAPAEVLRPDARRRRGWVDPPPPR